MPPPGTAPTGQQGVTLGGGSLSAGFANIIAASDSAYGVTTLFRGFSGAAPQQEPFDPKSNYASGPFRSSATKGQIIGLTDPAVGYGVKFLYNPSSISFGYQVDTAIKDPSQQDLSQMQIGLPQGTSTAISFQLYFDRTFEALAGSKLAALGDF